MRLTILMIPGKEIANCLVREIDLDQKQKRNCQCSMFISLSTSFCKLSHKSFEKRII